MLRDLYRVLGARTNSIQVDHEICHCKRPRQLCLFADMFSGLFVQPCGTLPNFIASSSVETTGGRNSAIWTGNVPYG